MAATELRTELRAWLEPLPQNEPFCLKNCCPLVTYWLSKDPSANASVLRTQTLQADFELVRAIDERTNWDHVTPREVIELIDATPYRTRRQVLERLQAAAR